MTDTARPDVEALGVNFYSPIGIVSGLGTAARGYLAALRAASVAVSLIPTHEAFLQQASIGRSQRPQRACHPIALVHINADAVHRFMHFHSRTLAKARYKIAIWVWELPAFRDEFWGEFSFFDEIWVPSSFCRRAIGAMTAKPVTVVPHAVSVAKGSPTEWRQALRIRPDEFVFLYMFDVASNVERKNPYCLVDAFQAAFAETAAVRLVLKVSNAENDLGFSRYLDELAARDGRCVVLRQSVSHDAVAGLLQACDCYVSPHRTEGFGLTVAEAMALGVPVIATDYGGTTDFLNEEVGFPLRYRLVEIDRDYGPYPQGGIWAEPSSEHLQQLLRGAISQRQLAAAKAARARAHIRDGYSPAAVGQQIRARLAAIRDAWNEAGNWRL